MICMLCSQRRSLNTSHFSGITGPGVGCSGLGQCAEMSPHSFTQTHPDDAVNDSGCDEWCSKTLYWWEFLDNTEIRRYVLLSNVCLNV